MSPRVAKNTMMTKPSALPHVSSSFAIGMYTAEVMAPATISITVKREWALKSLVTYGSRLARMLSLKPLVKNRIQILVGTNELVECERTTLGQSLQDQETCQRGLGPGESSSLYGSDTTLCICIWCIEVDCLAINSVRRDMRLSTRRIRSVFVLGHVVTDFLDRGDSALSFAVITHDEELEFSRDRHDDD